MELTAYTFRAPKQGEELDDCEDSIYPAVPGSGGDQVFAVSDGATTSFFAGSWARILTRRFADNPNAAFSAKWTEWLSDAQQEWQEDVRKRAQAKDASFYTRNDVLSKKPAAATFVGLVLEQPNESGTPWKALVLGDSCLFLLGADGVPHCLQLTTSDEFSNLVRTAESYDRPKPHIPKRYDSEPIGDQPLLHTGDTIILATDALSKWLLLRKEHGPPVWGSVLSLTTDSQFKEFIDNARREAEDPLENDDVALAVLKFGAPHEQYRCCIFEPKPTAEKPPKVPLYPTREPEVPTPSQPAIDVPRHEREHPAHQMGFTNRRVVWFALTALSLPAVLGVLLMLANNHAQRAEKEVKSLNQKLAEMSEQMVTQKEELDRDLRRAKEVTAQLRGEIDQQRRNLNVNETKLNEFTSTNNSLAQKVTELEESKRTLTDRLAKAAEQLKDSKPAESGKQLSEPNLGGLPISPAPAK